jgi:hypothetical protein
MSKSRFLAIVFLVGGLLLGLQACDSGTDKTATPNVTATSSVNVQPSPTNQMAITPTATPTNEWQTAWLKGIPCQPPCFENITPGKTTVDEAKQILPKNNMITKIWTYEVGERSNLRWDWKYMNSNNVTTTSYAFFGRAPNPSVISSIRPFFTAKVKLGDVIRAYGEPSYVNASVTPDYNNVNNPGAFHLTIIYQNKGIILDNYRYFTSTIKISPDTTFNDVSFFDPNDSEPLGSTTAKLITKWQGYLPFDFYCSAIFPENERCKS